MVVNLNEVYIEAIRIFPFLSIYSAAEKAIADLWQLAFSYQANPLAAVQPLPTATRGGR
jgi:hypothetical protein